MGSALFSQWVEAAGKSLPDHHFTVVDPQADPAEASDRVSIATDVSQLGDTRFDLAIVAVKPQLVDAVLPDYADRLADGGFVASIAAGCSIARLSKLANGAPVVRIMPNLPSAIGQGVSGLCAGDNVSDAQGKAVEQLLSVNGETVWVEDEDKLDRLTAISGSGPGYVFEIARAYVAAAEELGFTTEEARKLVLGTIIGTATMARDSGDDLETLRNSVTSKNGTTQAGLHALNADGALDIRLRAVAEAAYHRAVELR